MVCTFFNFWLKISFCFFTLWHLLRFPYVQTFILEHYRGSKQFHSQFPNNNITIYGSWIRFSLQETNFGQQQKNSFTVFWTVSIWLVDPSCFLTKCLKIKSHCITSQFTLSISKYKIKHTLRFHKEIFLNKYQIKYSSNKQNLQTDWFQRSFIIPELSKEI